MKKISIVIILRNILTSKIKPPKLMFRQSCENFWLEYYVLYCIWLVNWICCRCIVTVRNSQQKYSKAICNVILFNANCFWLCCICYFKACQYCKILIIRQFLVDYWSSYQFIIKKIIRSSAIHVHNTLMPWRGRPTEYKTFRQEASFCQIWVANFHLWQICSINYIM